MRRSMFFITFQTFSAIISLNFFCQDKLFSLFSFWDCYYVVLVAVLNGVHVSVPLSLTLFLGMSQLHEIY